MFRPVAAVAALTAVASLLLCLPAMAAETRPQVPQPSWWFGIGGGGAIPMGAFADHAEFSGAWEMFLACRLRQDSPFGVRLTGQAVEFARNDTTYALPGIDVRTRTASELLWLTLGPQLELGQGPARAILHAGAGPAWALTNTSVRGATNDAGSTHLQRAAFAFEAGGGLSYEITRARAIRLELGGRWLHTAPLEYVPESGLQRAAGAIRLTPRKDALDMAIVRAAIVMGLPARRP